MKLNQKHYKPNSLGVYVTNQLHHIMNRLKFQYLKQHFFVLLFTAFVSSIGLSQTEAEPPYSIDRAELSLGNAKSRSIKGVFQTEQGYTLLSRVRVKRSYEYRLVFLNEQLDLLKEVTLDVGLDFNLGDEFSVHGVRKVNSGYILELIQTQKNDHVLFISCFDFEGNRVTEPAKIIQKPEHKGLMKIVYRSTVSNDGEHYAVAWGEFDADSKNGPINCMVFDERLKLIKQQSFDITSAKDEPSIVELTLSNELNGSILTAMNRTNHSQYRASYEFVLHCWTNDEVFVHDIKPSKGTVLSTVKTMVTSKNQLIVAGYCCVPSKGGVNFDLLEAVEVFAMTSDDFGHSFDRSELKMEEKMDLLRMNYLVEEKDGEIVILGQKAKSFSDGYTAITDYWDFHIAKLSPEGTFNSQCIFPQEVRGNGTQYVPVPMENEIGFLRDLKSLDGNNRIDKSNMIGFTQIGDDGKGDTQEFDPFIGAGSGPYSGACSLDYSFKAVDGTSVFVFEGSGIKFMRIEFNEKI